MTHEFDNMLIWTGSPQAQCKCGRIHFTLSGHFMDEGELDGLLEKSSAEPDKFIGDVENDSIGCTNWEGLQLVWNCPCNALDKLEARIWSYRESFSRYYRARAERELREAQSVLENLAKPDESKTP